MKIITGILILFFSIHANAKCPWSIHTAVYNNGVQVAVFDYQSTTNAIVFISPNDSIIVTGWSDMGGSCNDIFLVEHNSDTIFLSGTGNSFRLVLSDTGHYHLYHFNQTAIFWNWDFDVFHSSTTGIQNTLINEQPRFYPSISEGIYKLQTTQKLKHLLIIDNAGRTLFETSNDFSEINLSGFLGGIYYYAITDEKEKVWRGKLIKD